MLMLLPPGGVAPFAMLFILLFKTVAFTVAPLAPSASMSITWPVPECCWLYCVPDTSNFIVVLLAMISIPSPVPDDGSCVRAEGVICNN